MKVYKTSCMMMKYNEYKSILRRLLIKMFKLNSLKKSTLRKKNGERKSLAGNRKLK